MSKYQIWCIYSNQDATHADEWSLAAEAEDLEELLIEKSKVEKIATNRMIITKAIDVQAVEVEL